MTFVRIRIRLLHTFLKLSFYVKERMATRKI